MFSALTSIIISGHKDLHFLKEKYESLHVRLVTYEYVERIMYNQFVAQTVRMLTFNAICSKGI